MSAQNRRTNPPVCVAQITPENSNLGTTFQEAINDQIGMWIKESGPHDRATRHQKENEGSQS